MENDTKCMNCGSENLRSFLDLGQQPNGNFFPSAEEKDNEPYFPFEMMVCRDCWQVQIREFPSPEFMFSNHPYITGVNMPVVDHFHVMVEHCVKRYDLASGDRVLDIGCNDGTLLNIFSHHGLEAVGVDPGKRTGKLARKAGIDVRETFWTEAFAEEFIRKEKRPRLITATSVFYHLRDIHDFIRGLRVVMEKDSVFVTQCVSLKEVIQNNQFDHFYHEHSMIHALTPLKRLFEQHGMRLIHVEEYEVHGGSFVLEVALEDSSYETDASVAQMIEAESSCGLQKWETYTAFAERIVAKRESLRALLEQCRSGGKTVDALGAPLKGSTLMNYCGIGRQWIRCAVEVNEFKIGRLTPGTHIPILDERTAYEHQEHPDYYLVAAWNFLEFFEEKYQDYLERGGQFIVPHPEVHCVRYPNHKK